VTAPLVEFGGVSKNYGGLRPLRIADLRVSAGEQIAIIGPDQPAAEVFVNLATGAALPDAGEVRLFGRPTAEIADSADWLATVDRFGIVSERAVLLEQLTVVQNLAMPFTLDIEPPPDVERRRAEALAREVGLPERSWSVALSALDAAAATRVRLGRAIALDPAILLLEHASARLPRQAAAALGAEIRALAERRGVALIAISADEQFSRAVAARVLTLEPATGRLRDQRFGWFTRRRM
jgi:ABC-type transporter Mla maintaining outer membrane lipid asymmetry ATPase subunit MlaF